MEDPEAQAEAPANPPISLQEYIDKQLGAQSTTRVLHADEEDPKKAAKAVKLEQITGQDAGYIYANHDQFVKDQKYGIVEDLLNKDRYLRDYVLSHPLAATISKNDWGNLSDYSQTLEDAQGMDRFYMPKGYGKAISDSYSAAWQDLKHSFQQFGYQKPTTYEEWKALSELSPEKRAQQEAFLAKKPPKFGDVQDIMGPVANLLSVVGPAIGGVISEASKDFENATGFPSELGEQIGMLAVGLAGVKASLVHPLIGEKAVIPQHGVRLPKEGERPRTLYPREVQEAQDVISNMVQRTDPWIRADEFPPIGADRFIDIVLGGDAHVNMKIVDDMIKSGDKTLTKQLSPEMLQRMTELATKRNMGLNYDDVRALYGDKSPSPGDGLLGDIPGVAEQFLANDKTGREIQVPIPAFVSKTLPEVWRALKESARIREEGATVREYEQFKTPEYQASRPSVPRLEIEGHSPEAEVERDQRRLDDVRTAAGIEPYFAREAGVPPKRLQLAPSRGVPYPALRGEHSFVIADEIGRHVADLELTPSADGRDLEINWIGGHVPMHQTPEMLRNMFSPGLLRDLLRQVQEQFPEAETISGTRLGPEEGGRVSIDLRSMEDPIHLENFRDILRSGDWVQFGKSTEALILPKGAWTKREKRIFYDIQTLINRILPEWAQVEGAHALRDPRDLGSDFVGSYISRKGMAPLVLWSLESEDAIGTARHEAIHFLRRQGFITQKEWDVLTDAAIKGNWIGRHKINKRYGNVSIALKLEEAIAEEYKTWANSKNKNEHSGNFVYQKLQRFLLELKEIVQKRFGLKVTADDLFENIEAGRVGSREHREAIEGFQQHWPDETTMRQLKPDEQSLALESAKAQAAAAPKEEQVPLFKPGVLHPKATAEKYSKAVARWWAKDLARRERRKVTEEKRRMAPEYRENYIAMDKEVRADIRNRPDFKVQDFFQRGILGDVQTNILPKLDPKYIWPHLKDAIPKQFLAEGGLNPADIAGHFGYQDGYSVVQGMADFRRSRGTMGPKEFFEKVVGDETERRMNQEYGTPDDIALKNARDDAVGHEQIELMYQDHLRFFELAAQKDPSVQAPITKEAFVQAAWEAVSEMKIKDANLKTSFAEMGRIFRDLESAYLGGRGDPVRAYKMSERRMMEITKSRLIRQVEKEMAAFERVAKAGYKREPTGLPFQYGAWLHHVLTRVGREVDRTPEDLAKALQEQQPQFTTLEDFANIHNIFAVGADEDGITRPPSMPVYEQLKDPNWSVDIDKTTVGEFRGINNTLQAIMKLGKDQESITVGTQKMLTREAAHEIAVQTQKQREKKRDLYPEGFKAKLYNLRAMAAGLKKWEFIAYRLDEFDRNGPWSRIVLRKVAAASNARADLEKQYGRRFQQMLKEVRSKYPDYDPQREVPNDVIVHPNSWEWTEEGKSYINPDTLEYLPMNEENMVMVILNWLNPSNRDKLVRGYKTSEQALDSWISTYSRKEHWEIADRIGELFGHLGNEMDEVTKRMNGSFMQRIPLPPVVSQKFGMRIGRYYPEVYNKTLGVNKALESNTPQPVKISTDKGMYEQRTDFAAPVDLGFTNINHQVKRRLDFVAWTETLHDLNKIAKDPEFQQALRKHYGEHYVKSFMDWAQDLAGRPGTMPAAANAVREVLNGMTRNAVGALVWGRTSTLSKHVPSAAIMGSMEALKGYPRALVDATITRAMQALWQTDTKTMRANHDFMMNGDPDIGYTGSKEMRNRSRWFKDRFENAAEYALGKVGSYRTWKDYWNQAGSAPFAIGDNFFSSITWFSKYNTELERLMHVEKWDYEDAVHEASDIADEAVRGSHGSLTTSNLSEFMRMQDPMMKNATALYGFWNNAFNRMFLMAARTKDMAMLKRNKTIWRDLGALSRDSFAYVIAPMIIEDLIEPICSDKDTNMKCLGKWGAFGAAGYIPGGRQLAWTALTATNPGHGVMGSGYRSLQDVQKLLSGKDTHDVDWGRTQKLGLMFLSALSGFGGGRQLGLVDEYVWNLTHGKEKKPSSAAEAMHLFLHGKTQEAKKYGKQTGYERLFGHERHR